MEISANDNTRLFLRPITNEEDASFVYNAFQKAPRNWVNYKYIPSKIHNKRQTNILNALVSERGAHVLICTLQSNPDVYLGCIVYEKVGDMTVIHFIYVKRGDEENSFQKSENKLRRHGIAKAMLLGAGIKENEPIYCSMVSPVMNFAGMEKYDFIHIPSIIDNLQF